MKEKEFAEEAKRLAVDILSDPNRNMYTDFEVRQELAYQIPITNDGWDYAKRLAEEQEIMELLDTHTYYEIREELEAVYNQTRGEN